MRYGPRVREASLVIEKLLAVGGPVCGGHIVALRGRECRVRHCPTCLTFRFDTELNQGLV